MRTDLEGKFSKIYSSRVDEASLLPCFGPLF